MYDEFHIESTNSRLVGRLWVMPQGLNIIRVSSHCCAREYDNVQQDDMFATVNGVDVRCSVTVQCNHGVWEVDGQYTYLERFGAGYPKKDVSWASRDLVHKVTRQIAASFAEKCPDKMLGAEIVSINNETERANSKLEEAEETVQGLEIELGVLASRLHEAKAAKVQAEEDNKAKAKAGGAP